ncbi:carbon-nitrogen hydrolase family protein [Amycolatopsis taiwanensis]|uniref:carbon-nitrogen hydrolase family protein n=1 Tax=Amycolatopsis taiwanensis TaxID=342230 RepID=UPI0004BB4739|nr:carbon-nitrogen hydrolase family protein [Amycolatopsis taiwanensis]
MSAEKPATVGIAQWTPTPGDPDRNEATATNVVAALAEQGCTVVVLPELWVCGYRPESLAADAEAAAESVDGPRAQRLSALAARHGVLLCAGTIVESAGGLLYNTALLFDPAGELVLAQRKVHLYPPGGEPGVFAAGTGFGTAETAALGRVGCAICFDGDFPETARELAAAGAGVVLAPAAYEASAASWWDTLYPAHAITNGQWWIMANQQGRPGLPMLGGSRIIAPDGRTVVAASRRPGAELELLIGRIDVDAERRHVAEAVRLLRRPVDDSSNQ